MRNLVGNTLVFLVSLAVVIGVLEVAVRIYSGAFFPKMMELDEQLGWIDRPELSEPLLSVLALRALARDELEAGAARLLALERELPS